MRLNVIWLKVDECEGPISLTELKYQTENMLTSPSARSVLPTINTNSSLDQGYLSKTQ